MRNIALRDCEEFVRRYWPANSALPKHEQLRKAITIAINEGYWPPGSRLPSELEWISATPCGLATVQRSLRSLAEEGLIYRRRGAGTIVAHFSRPLAEGIWHMRFLEQGGAESKHLPISTRVLARRVITRAGPWSEALNQSDQPVIKINRIMEIANLFDVYNIFYAREDMFPELATVPFGALHGVNLKKFIFQKYQISVHSVSHRISFKAVPKYVIDNCRWPGEAHATVLNAVAYSRDGKSLYYQDFYIPPNDLALDLGTNSWG